MEPQQPLIKAEGTLPDQTMPQAIASDSLPISEQTLSTLTARQRPCAVTIQDIPDKVDLGTMLNSEPQWSEGLVSMTIKQGPPRTATLTYSAAAFAEALLFRCAKSLNGSWGLKLSVAPQQAAHSEDQFTNLRHQAAKIITERSQVIVPAESPTLQVVALPSNNTNPNLADHVALEVSDDDCIMLSSNPINKSTNRRILTLVHNKKALSTPNTSARKSSSQKMSSTHAGTTSSSSPMPKDLQKFLKNTLQALSKRKDAVYFTQSAKYSRRRIVNVPYYPDIIKKPMDLERMKDRLKWAWYRNVDDLTTDFAQIVENTIKFNGPDHQITKDALHLKAFFDSEIEYFMRGEPRNCQNIEAELQNPQKRKRSSPAAVPVLEGSGITISDDQPLIPHHLSRKRQAKDGCSLS